MLGCRMAHGKEKPAPVIISGHLRLRVLACRWILLIVLLSGSRCLGQNAPTLPDQPWHSEQAQQLENDAQAMSRNWVTIDAARTYSLAELINMGEAHNPETRLAWERSRAQAARLGIARSALYPTIAAAALSATRRSDAFLGRDFALRTVQVFQAALELNYTVFDFGARAGRIDAAKADLLAANFAFNDTHRKVIYEVEEAYYELLNAMGQEEAARASLANAQAVQQASEERLKQGLSTLPDVLEARSASAQADYKLQAVRGAEEIARGHLAKALGASPTTTINVQPLAELSIPDSIGETAEQGLQRSFAERPDLTQEVAELRSAKARLKEARADRYPSLSVNAIPVAQSLYGLQQPFPWARANDLAGGLQLNLNWTVFDGGAIRNNIVRTQANVEAAESQATVQRDQIAEQVWTAYSNLKTALRQRQAATALLAAASQSYDAALESYNLGLRSLLDVTAAQQTLAQARSAEVLARTQVLSALADLGYETGDLIKPRARRP